MAFAPNTGQIIVAAFARLQVRRTELTATHMADARTEANLLQAEWGNEGPNLWTVDQQELAITQGLVTYALPLDTIDLLEVYLSVGPTTQTTFNSDIGFDAGVPTAFTDRILTALGRDEYVAIPNKLTQALPTSFWFQKGRAPQLNLYPAPDQAYTLFFWRERQIQDVDFANAGSPETPYLWLDAFTAGLSHRLARIYKPELEGVRKGDADLAWAKAAEQDIERVPLYISPNVASYYR